VTYSHSREHILEFVDEGDESRVVHVDATHTLPVSTSSVRQAFRKAHAATYAVGLAAMMGELGGEYPRQCVCFGCQLC
jgi:hypothetical protein